MYHDFELDQKNIYTLNEELQFILSATNLKTKKHKDQIKPWLIKKKNNIFWMLLCLLSVVQRRLYSIN